jgi:sirohydrochlorin cobaltochelatase
MLIAIAHGSRDPAWCAAVERQIAALREDLERDAVRLAFMELSPPTLLDVVAEVAQLGITRIRILPLFLAGEGHVEKNVVPQVNEVRRRYRSLDVELLPPLGQLVQFRELLRALASEDIG